MLLDDRLDVYRIHKDCERLRSSPVLLLRATARPNESRTFAFELSTPSEQTLMAAESEDEMQAWLDALAARTAAQLEQQEHSAAATGDSVAGASGSDVAAASGVSVSVASGQGAASAMLGAASVASGASQPGASASTAGSATDATASASKPRRNTASIEQATSAVVAPLAKDEFLQKVQAVPGNKKCADCGEAEPTWCSLNVGVLLCVQVRVAFLFCLYRLLKRRPYSVLACIVR